MRLRTRRRLARGALAVVGSVVLMLSVVHTAAHAEEPEQEVTTSPDDPAGWEGTLATGTNTDYNAQTGEPCGDDVEDQCETVLLHVDVPDGYWDQRGGGLQVHLDDYLPNPASDFDLYISCTHRILSAQVSSAELAPSIHRRLTGFGGSWPSCATSHTRVV